MKDKSLRLYNFLIIILLSSTLFQACNEDTQITDCNTTFDQSAMFTNIAYNLILPAYDDLQNQVDNLYTKINLFVTAPTVVTLEEVRMAHIEAYLAWQKAAQYEFGPAEEVFLRSVCNNFPANIEEIESNIQAEMYKADAFDTYDKGFPALDYLLFGIAENNNNLIVEKYINQQGYCQYLKDIVVDMQERITTVNDAWKNGYTGTFINRRGTAAGTSLSLLVNALNQNYELIKREKLGIPSGVLTLDFPNPERVEAPYSGQSIRFVIAALEASQNLYLGVSNTGQNGLGLDDYLLEVDAKKADGTSLNTAIQERFQTAINTATNLGENNRLDELINTDRTSSVSAYNDVVKQLVNIKTDMPSVLCVSITYVDNPSDTD